MHFTTSCFWKGQNFALGTRSLSYPAAPPPTAQIEEDKKKDEEDKKKTYSPSCLSILQPFLRIPMQWRGEENHSKTLLKKSVCGDYAMSVAIGAS